MKTIPSLLSVKEIEVVYNRSALVLKDVSLEVPKGGIVALLGANGAGKTTTLKAISNLIHSERGEVTKGSVEFMGERVDTLTADTLVRRGVVQVMEVDIALNISAWRRTSSPGPIPDMKDETSPRMIWKRSITISQA